MKNTIISVILTALGGVTLNAQQLAFPTAEGYGKYTVGGRGGAVYEVTNLNATGTGSLGAAISASGPRTVVFRVSGTIEGNFSINNDKITIAGQTAPGDGICIKGRVNVNANDVIIRYIRVRLNPSVDADAIGGRYKKNIIIDHVSASWSSDEVMSFYHNENVTIQWCMITEGCAKFENGINIGHRFGGIWGNNYGTYHHNLFAHNDSRNPRWASGCRYNDYRNNVLYNWGYQSCYGGEALQEGLPEGIFSTINMIDNYYKPGPATQSGVRDRIAEPSARSTDDKGSWYVAGNYVNGYPAVTANNWLGVDGSNYIKLSAPWDAMPIYQETPEDAYNAVLAYAGCSKPNRDTIDKRIIREAASGTATYGNNGIITYPGDVGGWPALASGIPPDDTDHDGMPDSFEIANSLSINNPDDRNDIGAGGYTMLEIYLNSLTGYIPVPVTGVSVEPDSVTMEKNQTYKLSSIINPYNATNQIVTWSSNEPSVATVNASGFVMGVDSGRAVITVTAQDGGFTDSCAVEVIIVPVTGITVDPASVAVDTNRTAQLTATVSPANATNKNVSWFSSDTLVATVNASGLVRGVAHGTVVITATTEDGGFTDTSAVEVTYIPVTGIVVEPDSVAIGIGGTTQLIATVIPVNASNENVIWSSNDTSVAKVSPSGLVTGIGLGSAFITAETQDGGFTGICVVNVNSLPMPLISLQFNESSGSSVTNTGSVPATFNKTTSPSWSSNIPANGGASSVDFGTTIGNYYVESASVISQLAGLTSFTVTGWVNCRNATMGSGGNRIVSWIYNGGNGVDIVYISDGSLQVGINQWPDGSMAISNTGRIPAISDAPASNWRFFAVAYNSSTGKLDFYFGDNTTAATLDKTLIYNQGAVGTTIGKLAVGHFNDESKRTSRTDRMFRGLIDKVDIFGSVLALQEIQAAQFYIPFSIPVTGVAVNPANLTLEVGNTYQLTETVTPSDATTKAVTWSSDNTAVAMVSSSGLVTGVSQGLANIVITTQDGNFTDSCNVTITNASYSPAVPAEKAIVNFYPNPFSDEIHFEISVPEPQKVLIELFDINGKKIATMADRTFEAGNNVFIWNANGSGYSIKPGVYIVSITTCNSVFKKGITLIRK